MKYVFPLAMCALLLLAMGCTGPVPPSENVTDGTRTVGGNQNANTPGNNPTVKYSEYKDAKSFKTFTDPREGAFSLEVPSGWVVTEGSGIIRPYIDAGVGFEAKSSSGQGFFLQEPYGYVYTTPNTVLDYAGFKEGSLYNPSGGVAKPMMVKKYTLASDFIKELIGKSGLNVSNLKVTDRPDLLVSGNPLISKQSAAEAGFEYELDGKRVKSVVALRTALVELSGTGIWSVGVMEYYAPPELLNETELLAVTMQRSFKLNETWAKKEQEEVQKRLGAIGKSGGDISEIISSTIEMRSKTMDDLNGKWDKYILGIEDTYDPDTGEHYVVDSGSKYYWVDDQNRIYGSDTADSPRPKENLRLLKCPGC
jgi:hypothetical protein